MYLNKQKEGFELEERIHDILIKTNLVVYREKDIIKKYGKLYYGIDHLIYNDNFIIGIQDKWTDKKPSLSQVNHFIKSLEKIGTIENTYCIGIYMSKVPITSGALASFGYENSNSSNKFFNLDNPDKETLINNLMHLFYQNEIYLFDGDDSCVMIN